MGRRGCRNDPQARILTPGRPFRFSRSAAREHAERSPVNVRSLPLFPALLFFAAAPVLAGPVSGRIVDPDSRPIASARVIATGGGLLRSELTNARGEFTVRIARRREIRTADCGGRFPRRAGARGRRSGRARSRRCPAVDQRRLRVDRRLRGASGNPALSRGVDDHDHHRGGTAGKAGAFSRGRTPRRARLDRGRHRGPGRRHRRFPARRRIELHAGVRGRRAGERLRW